ncbi:MAG: PAS domain S-box protein, partial [Synechocystis sp.]
SEMVLAKLPQEERQKLLERHQIHIQDKLPYELMYRYPTPDGRQKYIWDRVESVFDDQGQPIRTRGTCQDVTATYRYQAILQQLVDGTASVTGENFFNALVQHLAQALEVEYAIVAINHGAPRSGSLRDRLQTLAWVAHGELQPTMSYPIAQTPCEIVVYQGEYFCASQLRARFPEDPDLNTLEAETYLGMALRGETGEIIGHLCVLHTQPWAVNLVDDYRQIMRIFAARASVELQRNLANEQLQQLNQSLEAKIVEQTHLLAETAQFQQAIFDSTDYYIVTTDVDGVIMSVNAGAERLYGYAAAELIGKATPLIFNDPEDLPRQAEILTQVVGDNVLPGMNLFLEAVRKTGRLDIEVMTQHRNGHRIPLALTLTPLKDADQMVIGFLGIGKNISREKSAIQALEASERRYNVLVAASPVGIFQNDVEGACVYGNDRCFAMTGLTPESALGMGWVQTIHPDDRDWVIQAWQKFVQDQNPFNEEYRFVLPDGLITWVMGQAVVDRDEAGNVVGYLGSLTDITQRKQAELDRQTAITQLEEVVQQLQLAQQAIGQSNRLLKTITKAQAQFIIAADRLTIFEELLTDLLDLTNSEYGFIGEVLFRDDGTAVLEESLMTIKGVPYLKAHSITNIAWDEATQKLYEENYQTGMEFTNMNTLFGAVIMTGKPVIANSPRTDPRRGGTPNGHPPLDAFLGLPFFRGDALMGMVGIANRPGGYDEEIIAFLNPFLITCSNLIEGYRGDRQRRQAEAQLQLTNEELLRVTRLKDEFLANMSHELRTPLNAILGNPEILEDELYGPINAQQLTSLHTITKSSHHLLALINDILDVAKIESGQIELHYSAIAISTLCQTCVAFITPQVLKRQIQLQTHFSSELPNNFQGDERRVRQVLINLLNNAVKFTPEGGTISLTVSLQAPKPPNTFPCLRFAIADTGIGITPDNLTKLFRPFIQIDSALNRQYEGTGLGLALVKQIVELHGGEVGVTSQWGEGSCFTVDFPYNPTE